jgi:hypothetical protein
VRQRQALLQPDLAWRRVEQVGAADDGVDPLCGVVDDHRQLVGKLAVGTQQDEIADGAFCEVLPQGPLHAIVESEISRLPARAFARRAPPVQRPDRHGRFPGIHQAAIDRRSAEAGGNLAPRTGAGIRLAGELQPGQCRPIEIQTPALDDDLAIPLKAEAFKRPQDAVGCARAAPRLVDVFDAQQPFAAVGARVKVAADCGDQRAEVQRTRSAKGAKRPR